MELIAIGSLSSSISNSKSLTTFRFEHFLFVAPSSSFGYSHSLQFRNIEDVGSVLDFNNIFEFASSSSFTFAPVLGIIASIPKQGKTTTRLNFQLGFFIYPSPKSMISLTPGYSIFTDDMKQNSILGNLGISMRF